MKKNKVAKVQFELDLNITNLELKSQPSTPLNIREQHEAAIKDGVVTIDSTVVDCIVLFEQFMEVVIVL